MKALEQHVLSLQDPPFELSSILANVIENQFYQRWKMLAIDLHYATTFLNPYLLGEACLHGDVDVKEALNIILQKIVDTLIAYALTFKKIVDFVES
jgi:hypothetical protein